MPKRARMPPGGEQQRCCRRRFGAELAGQVEDRVALRQRQPHDQAKRAGDAGGPRLVEDLGQLGSGIEREVAHAVTCPGLADGGARLDRVHEVDLRVGEHAASPAPPRWVEAQSKCRTSPAHSARSTAGSGLHFTA